MILTRPEQVIDPRHAHGGMIIGSAYWVPVFCFWPFFISERKYLSDFKQDGMLTV
jgi:hypothetical protein